MIDVLRYRFWLERDATDGPIIAVMEDKLECKTYRTWETPDIPVVQIPPHIEAEVNDWRRNRKRIQRPRPQIH